MVVSGGSNVQYLNAIIDEQIEGWKGEVICLYNQAFQVVLRILRPNFWQKVNDDWTKR